MKIQPYHIFYLLVTLLGQAHANETLIVTEISLDDAAKMVTESSHLLDAETKNIKDRNVHIIKILTEDGRVKKYKIDAQTGKHIGGKDKN